MQELVLELWRLYGPFVAHHIGDLSWRRYQHLGKLREVRLRLWCEGRATMAWGWLWRDQGDLDFEVHPERLDLLPEVIAWGKPRAVWSLDRRPELTEIIARLGYTRSSEGGFEHHVREIRGEIEDPHLPHRRLGLATAVCLGALRSLAKVGATRAVVNSRSGSIASKLYESIGMHSIAKNIPFVRRGAGS